MNQFANLSAESEVSALAQVSAAEVFAAEPVAPRASRGVNVSKLVRRNLAVPFAARIAHADLAARVAFAPVRASLVTLHAQIRAEVEVILDAQRAVIDSL